MFSKLSASILAALTVCVVSACSSDTTPTVTTPSSVVFNEISASGGEEWFELYNTGSSTVDLSGYGVTDSDKETGQARVKEAMRFPSGTKLAKGAYLLVLLGKDDAAPGPYSADACLSGVGVGCFYATFSISAARAEAVHLIGADDEVLVSTIYPADLTFEAGTGFTVCRLPDGDEGLTTCVATPGAANEGP